MPVFFLFGFWYCSIYPHKKQSSDLKLYLILYILNGYTLVERYRKMKETVRHSILSGVLIGIGTALSVQTENIYVRAMLFSVALLVIIDRELKLYTGKIGYIKDIPLKTLGVILVFNFIGVASVIFALFTKSGFYEQCLAVAIPKFQSGHLELFVRGFMCGICMFIAVHCKKPLITVFCIMTFILAGFEHCIVDFPYLCINFSWDNLLKFMLIVLGNSLGSITINALIKKD